MLCITFDALPEDLEELEAIHNQLSKAGYNPSPIGKATSAIGFEVPGFDVICKDEHHRYQMLGAGAPYMGVTYRTENIG